MRGPASGDCAPDARAGPAALVHACIVTSDADPARALATSRKPIFHRPVSEHPQGRHGTDLVKSIAFRGLALDTRPRGAATMGVPRCASAASTRSRTHAYPFRTIGGRAAAIATARLERRAAGVASRAAGPPGAHRPEVPLRCAWLVAVRRHHAAARVLPDALRSRDPCRAWRRHRAPRGRRGNAAGPGRGRLRQGRAPVPVLRPRRYVPIDISTDYLEPPRAVCARPIPSCG